MSQDLTPFEKTIIEALRAFYKQNQELTRQVSRLADAVERMAPANTVAPNYQRPLESFTKFDWASISATVERSDQYGAAVVNWHGQQFTRRSPSNKFGEAVWFSRCVGKSEDGQNVYERLITFKPVSKVEVEPLPNKVTRLTGQDSD
ncbi:single-stranded DNA-binding protein [Trichocoleus sp. Lan]|uniref:single-stranded DNA-binding protein n=1 Tax=Trichocoleus sp. Lan TaxID=2933927 RepID=UPI003299F998